MHQVLVVQESGREAFARTAQADDEAAGTESVQVREVEVVTMMDVSGALLGGRGAASACTCTCAPSTNVLQPFLCNRGSSCPSRSQIGAARERHLWAIDCYTRDRGCNRGMKGVGFSGRADHTAAVVITIDVALSRAVTGNADASRDAVFALASACNS